VGVSATPAAEKRADPAQALRVTGRQEQLHFSVFNQQWLRYNGSAFGQFRSARDFIASGKVQRARFGFTFWCRTWSEFLSGKFQKHCRSFFAVAECLSMETNLVRAREIRLIWQRYWLKVSSALLPMVSRVRLKAAVVYARGNPGKIAWLAFCIFLTAIVVGELTGKLVTIEPISVPQLMADNG
jgi:hypothetical protein